MPVQHRLHVHPTQSQHSCCLQGALLSEFLAEPLQISSLTCALPVGASTGAQILAQLHHSSGQEASVGQRRSSPAAPPALPQRQGTAAQQESVMLQAAHEALLRAVSGQCRVQAGSPSSCGLHDRPSQSGRSSARGIAGRTLQAAVGRPAAAKAPELCMQGRCAQPVALSEWLSCSSSRIDSCCPAASGLLHCLQGEYRGSTAAWPHPSGMLFQQCICWTCLSHWQAWLWRQHRRGRCAQVGLQGQVCLHGCDWGMHCASAPVSFSFSDARQLSGGVTRAENVSHCP